MEREQSLEQLGLQKDRLSKILGQRQHLVGVLTPTESDPHKLTLREARQLALAEKVGSSIPRIETSIALIENKIDNYLPSLYQDWQTELIRKSRELRSIEAGIMRGGVKLTTRSIFEI